jgi:hypothetical protein
LSASEELLTVLSTDFIKPAGGGTTAPRGRRRSRWASINVSRLSEQASQRDHFRRLLLGYVQDSGWMRKNVQSSKAWQAFAGYRDAFSAFDAFSEPLSASARLAR